MSHKIAIIEDDSVILKMYVLKFEKEGFVVKTASNGKLGLDLVKDFKPEVILLDLMMPEMNGDEMLAKMRKTSWGKKVKVLVFTNVGAEEVSPELEKYDVAEVILKAYHTPAQIVTKVKALLSK